ncbi:hypothetical protein BY458DRAFT_427931 [Sporodiniella umbellata]|nr:hypothetical protein BY458DRAFT_427931 [Sporodiniella umbellata]
MNRWSIRQANSRLHAHDIHTSLDNDLSRKIQDEKVQTGIAIPLDNLNTSNPYLRAPSSQRRLKAKTYGFQDPFASAPMEAWQEIKDYNLRVNGLPTLEQMMRLHTYNPLTQSHFSTFLENRDARQNLTFLMELETHEKLWRALLQSVDRQNRQRLSRFLEAAEKKEPSYRAIETQTHYAETPDTEDLLNPPTFMATTLTMPTSDRSLSHEDLVQNAQRIYYTFCAREAKRVHLPEDYRAVLEETVIFSKRPEPLVFDSAKSHVFEVLNMFYYPLFVEQILSKNISRATSRLLFLLGILLLTLAFSIELALIFLDSYTSRWIPLIPFFFGWSALLTSVTEFAWWFGLTSISEIQFMDYTEIQDVVVKKIHFKRGWLWLAFIVLLSVLNTILFVFIPAHRL